MIRRRLMLVAAPLCVVVVAASVAFASTTDTEHASDGKRDDLHVERPIAASDVSDVGLAQTAEQLRAVLQHQADEAALRFTVAAQLKLDADRAVAEAFAATLTRVAAAPASHSGAGAGAGSDSGGSGDSGSGATP
ncbi:MAG: hypothetical protein ACHQIG_07495, partial [Acidimicrobiia bacterium]